MHDYVDVRAKDESAARAAAAATALDRHSSDGDDMALISTQEYEEARAAAAVGGSPSRPADPSVSPGPVDSSSLVDERDSCVCCALKLIFIHYEHSDSSIIPPDTLRYALSLLLDNQGGNKFRMREMSDAEEALDEVLKYLHWDHVGMAAIPPPAAGKKTEESALSRSLDITCNPTCISHQVFGSQLMDQKICATCQATSDPEMSCTFLYRLYVSEVISTKKAHKDWSFEDLLKHSYLSQDYSCPSPNKSMQGPGGKAVPMKCKGPAKIERWVLNLPEVFAMMCVWSGAETERSEIEKFFAIIPQELHVDRFLKVQQDTPLASALGAAVGSGGGASASPPSRYSYVFRGMILYYGRHYLAVFWSPAFQSYVMFDDKRVSNLGTWEQVVERCTKGKLQPTVILYEAADPRVAAKLAEDCAAADAADAARVEREKQEALKSAGVNAAAPPSPPWSMQTQASPSPPAAAAPAAAASAAAAMSPQSANNSEFFNSHAAPGQSHIISAPVTSASSVATASSSAMPSRASTGSAASSSSAPPSMPRQPPAVIPSYFGGSSNSSGDQKEADDAEYERTVWDAQQIGGGASSMSASPPMLQAASASPPPFGFAGPSQSARNLALLSQAAAVGSPPVTRPWVCLGCNHYFQSSVAYGQCPRCTPAGYAQPQHRGSAEQMRQLEMQRARLAAGHGFTVRR